MDPDDIPTSITQLVYTAPRINPRSQNDAAEHLAHYWPAIEQHIRSAIAEEFAERGKSQGMFSWGEAALIARGEL